MTKPTNQTSNNLVGKSAVLLTQRLSLIRALYVASIATNGPREDINREFHQAVGEVLEGVNLDDIILAYIDVEKVKEEIAWLRERKHS